MATRKSRRAAAKQARKRAPGQAGQRIGAGLIDEMTDTLMMGRACSDQGKPDEAAELFRRGIREQPHNVRAYVLSARAHAQRFEFVEMEAVLARLERLAPQHPGVHHFIGETFGLVRQVDRAAASFERACALPGVLPGTWMELATLYERSHRLDEARDLLDRAGRAGLNLPALKLIEARLQRREKDVAGAEATLEKMIQSLPADDPWVSQAWGEIAMIRDKQGDSAGAVQAIESCKQAQLGTADAEWRVASFVSQRFREVVETISAADFTRWRDEGADLPDRRTAILTGFPRSGTTLLEQVLDAHPDLISSEERDFLAGPQFSSLHAPGQAYGPILEVLNGLSPKRIRTEQKRYFAVMEHLLGESIAGRMHLDKNPAYNPFLPVVLRLFPQTRILIALRDPRDVVLSCYLRYLPLNPVSVNFLTVERTAQRYALDMNAWLRFREIVPNPWCEVRYEDSVADLEKQARRALETLGLPWDPAVMNYRDRLGKERQVNSPTYEAVKQPVYTRSVGRWKHYEELLAPAYETLSPFIEAFGYDG